MRDHEGRERIRVFVKRCGISFIFSTEHSLRLWSLRRLLHKHLPPACVTYDGPGIFAPFFTNVCSSMAGHTLTVQVLLTCQSTSWSLVFIAFFFLHLASVSGCVCSSLCACEEKMNHAQNTCLWCPLSHACVGVSVCLQHLAVCYQQVMESCLCWWCLLPPGATVLHRLRAAFFLTAARRLLQWTVYKSRCWVETEGLQCQVICSVLEDGHTSFDGGMFWNTVEVSIIERSLVTFKYRVNKKKKWLTAIYSNTLSPTSAKKPLKQRTFSDCRLCRLNFPKISNCVDNIAAFAPYQKI